MITRRKDKSFTDMTVPKLTSDDFEGFDLDLQGSARRQFGMSRIPIEHLL